MPLTASCKGPAPVTHLPRRLHSAPRRGCPRATVRMRVTGEGAWQSGVERLQGCRVAAFFLKIRLGGHCAPNADAVRLGTQTRAWKRELSQGREGPVLREGRVLPASTQFPVPLSRLRKQSPRCWGDCVGSLSPAGAGSVNLGKLADFSPPSFTSTSETRMCCRLASDLRCLLHLAQAPPLHALGGGCRWRGALDTQSELPGDKKPRPRLLSGVRSGTSARLLS